MIDPFVVDRVRIPHGTFSFTRAEAVKWRHELSHRLPKLIGEAYRLLRLRCVVIRLTLVPRHGKDGLLSQQYPIPSLRFSGRQTSPRSGWMTSSGDATVLMINTLMREVAFDSQGLNIERLLMTILLPTTTRNVNTNRYILLSSQLLIVLEPQIICYVIIDRNGSNSHTLVDIRFP